MFSVSAVFRKWVIALFLLILPVSFIYAKQDAVKKFGGVYAQNETWSCQGSQPPLQVLCPSCWTEFITAQGKITYFGDGNAQGLGRYSYTNNDEHTAADIGTYTCNYTYQLTGNEISVQGSCLLNSLTAPGPAATLTNQKWIGHISQRGESIILGRHDLETEGTSSDGFTNDIAERVCGKVGNQVKIGK